MINMCKLNVVKKMDRPLVYGYVSISRKLLRKMIHIIVMKFDTRVRICSGKPNGDKRMHDEL